MSATLSSRLLATAVSDAKSVLAAAQTTSLNDDLALAASHTSLAAALKRVLWALDGDDEPDVAAQVDAEDGITRPRYVRYVRSEQVAA